MPAFSYRTIQLPATGLYKDKGSKFLSFAHPVMSDDEIKAHLESSKKAYFDARHHCFAWMLGVERKNFRAFDDGEPNHSAGDPILGQIKSRELTNILVIVVRYFGGVKLGVGGLISAYKNAADDALGKALIIEREVTGNLQLTYGYTATAEIMRLIKEFDMVIVDQKFETACEVNLEFKLRDKKVLIEKLALYKALNIDVAFNAQE